MKLLATILLLGALACAPKQNLISTVQPPPAPRLSIPDGIWRVSALDIEDPGDRIKYFLFPPQRADCSISLVPNDPLETLLVRRAELECVVAAIDQGKKTGRVAVKKIFGKKFPYKKAKGSAQELLEEVIEALRVQSAHLPKDRFYHVYLRL